MAGYRFQLPEKIHPISSGVKGGIVGGLVMPIPALGLRPHQWPWHLVPREPAGRDGRSRNQRCDRAQLEQFQLAALILAICIHATFSVAFGLFFGVVSPTLPPLPGGPVIAGGVLMPLLWTGLCYGFMGIIDPLLEEHVNWLWFIASQVVYGLAMSIVVIKSEKVPVPPVGGGPRFGGFPGARPGWRSFVNSRVGQCAVQCGMAGSLDAADLARRLGGRLRSSRPAQDGDRYVPPRRSERSTFCSSETAPDATERTAS